MNIVLAPSGFKESVSAEHVAANMKEGIIRALPEAKVISVPLFDGGEGFTETMVAWTDGTLHSAEVTGPINQQVKAIFGFLTLVRNVRL